MREYIQLPSSGLILSACISLFLMQSCRPSTDLRVDTFQVQLPGMDGTGLYKHDLDLDKAILQGISYPYFQDEDSLISFEFSASGLNPNEVLAYKVFYKNTSYSSEHGDDFYGGWGTADESFRKAVADERGKVIVKDGFRIRGNPRNESKYFGAQRKNPNPLDSEIKDIEANIRTNPEWFQTVKDKALKDKISVDDQVTKDAIWVLRTKPDEGPYNNRWKRNPRMGAYEFMLVVMDSTAYTHLSSAEKDLTQKSQSSEFIDPFLFFPEKRSCATAIAKERLELSCRLDPSKGIFINRLTSESTEWHPEVFSNSCGDSDSLFTSSHWEQFFHGIHKDYYLKNIPMSADVVAGYTRDDYDRNKTLYPLSERDSSLFHITAEPCATVSVEGDSCIVLTNIAHRKEPVGVRSRIGMTYGTYTLKVAFPEMLSDDYVWNGLTNAFWLIYESDAEWNQRHESASGYLLKHQREEDPILRFPTTHYSEIDIEIVKAAEHWPASSYGTRTRPEFDLPANNKSIVVAATNWDMADQEVDEFLIGAQAIPTPYGTFTFNRWSEVYNALTSKRTFSHDEILGREVYYFQIEWHPDHIIWRMGPSKDRMYEFNYIDRTYTNIPDNQMLAVITQEFHASEWWPTAPFSQNDIPFPSEPLIGRVMEVTIE